MTWIIGSIVYAIIVVFLLRFFKYVGHWENIDLFPSKKPKRRKHR